MKRRHWHRVRVIRIFFASRSCDWSRDIHDGSRKRTKLVSLRQFTTCHCSHRTLLVLPFSFSIGQVPPGSLVAFVLASSFTQTSGFHCGLTSLEFAGQPQVLVSPAWLVTLSPYFRSPLQLFTQRLKFRSSHGRISALYRASQCPTTRSSGVSFCRLSQGAS